MKITIHIYRNDPDSTKEPEYQTFEINAEKDETVSGILQYIYKNIDPSLAFRLVCNMQKCGECAVLVNGNPCLACEKKIEPEMTVDPLPNLPIIKDLAIDRFKVIQGILRLDPFLEKSSEIGGVGPAHFGISDDSIKLGKCLECLICQSACPAYTKYPDRFVGPLGLLWITQRSLDCREDTDYCKREAYKALEMCDLCGKCWKVCPDDLNLLAGVFKKFRNYRKKVK